MTHAVASKKRRVEGAIMCRGVARIFWGGTLFLSFQWKKGKNVLFGGGEVGHGPLVRFWQLDLWILGYFAPTAYLYFYQQIKFVDEFGQF